MFFSSSSYQVITKNYTLSSKFQESGSGKTEERNSSASKTVSAENGPDNNRVADKLSRVILGISSVFSQYALSFAIHIFKFPQPLMPITLSPCGRLGEYDFFNFIRAS